MKTTDDLHQLIEKYKEYARIHYAIDFLDRTSVRKGNRAAKQMLLIVERIDKDFENGVDVFAHLLTERQHKIDCWAAFDLMERMRINKQQQQKALEVIERYAQSDEIDAYGIKLWLRNWTKKKL